MKNTRHLLVAVGLTTLLSGATMIADSPLADAAQRRDVETVRRLLRQGAKVNEPQGDGMTALHWTAEYGDATMTQLLLRAGARVSAVTRIGSYTPLHLASKAGSAPVIQALIKAGSDVKALTSTGVTALHLASAAGNVDAVNALIDKGAAVNAPETEWGQTPLIFAASADRPAVIRALLERGADPKAMTRVVNLVEAAAQDQAATRRRNDMLAEFQGIKRDSTARRDSAARPAGSDSTRVMATPATIRQQAAPAGTEPTGTAAGTPAPPRKPATPAQIQQAISEGRKVLLTPPNRPAAEEADTADGQVAGYPASVGAMGGLTALHHAVRQGNVESVLALLDGGADVNQRSGGDSTTPLLQATINGQFDVAMKLIERGANPKLASIAGATPLYATINTQWAPRSRFPQPEVIQNQKTTYLEVMEALLKAGADPNVRIEKHLWYFAYNNCGNSNCGLENLEGTTPFWRAAYSVDVAAMKLLVAHGADPKIPSKPPVRAGRGGRGGGRGGAAGGRGGGPDPNAIPLDSAARNAPVGAGVYPVHAAAGVGYGNGFAGNSHRHAPGGWMPAMKYVVEELGANVNERDQTGYTPLHHAAARGDNEMILYLVSKGADVKAVARNGRTTVDMANGPVQRLRPLPETIALLEKLGAKNNHRCVSC